jgi:hypothetical protein
MEGALILTRSPTATGAGGPPASTMEVAVAVARARMGRSRPRAFIADLRTNG